MAICRKCKKTREIAADKAFGICDTCRDELNGHLAEYTRLMGLLETHEESSGTEGIRPQDYEKVISHLRYLLSYEQSSIPILETPPSELIRTYSRHHDLLSAQGDMKKMQTAFASAERALEPFGNLYAVRNVLDALYEAKRLIQGTPRKRVVAVINQKGGVGKTTATINIGAGLARNDMNILLIDLDPQANLTDAMGIHDEDISYSVYDILKGSIPLKDAIIHKNGLSILPASVLLARADKEFSDQPLAHQLLKNALADLKEFDYIFIDCLPSLGILTLNALMAAHEIIVPVLPEYFALTGVQKLLDAMEFIKEEGNPDIFVSTVLFNRFDPRKGHHREVAGRLNAFFGSTVDFFNIRDSIALAEAASCGIPIFQYRPKCKGAQDYRTICSHIVENKTLPSEKPHKSAPIRI